MPRHPTRRITTRHRSIRLRSLGLVLTLCLTILGLAPTARAGSGYVDANGDAHLNLHFRFPPFASDLTRVQEQVQRASQLLCDATEGQMRIASMRLGAGGTSEVLGDIWYYPPGAIGRSRANGAPLHDKSRRIFLAYDDIRSDVLVHELGHLILGLPDQYDEQRRFGGACGIGPAFDADVLLDEQNHTMMQQSGYQRCVAAGGIQTSRACFEDANCNAGETCPLPALMSEFSVPANYDQLRGDDALPADTCPAPRFGTVIEVAGVLGADAVQTAFDATDFASANATAVAGKAREYIDELGIVTGYDTDSAHPIWIWAERVGPQSWIFHFGIDEKHLVGGTPGTLRILDSVDVQFEATPSVVVPNPGGSDFAHRIVERVDGVLVTDPGYLAPTVTIPDLEGMAGPRILIADFEGLEERALTSGGDLGPSAITWFGLQQLGTCGETTACEGRWNESTQRWEASASSADVLIAGGTPRSEWEQLVAKVDRYYDASFTAPTGLPEVDAPSVCDRPVDFDVAVEGIDQVYLVLDRSGSMLDDRTWTGVTRTRLDWAKASARAFADLLTNQGAELGVISFALDNTEDIELGLVVEDGAGTPGANEIDDIHLAIDGLFADGDTAIGDALEAARFSLAGETQDRTQAILLMSDGEENGGQLDPRDVADALRDDGVPVFSVPLGNDSDGETLAAVAEMTGGQVKSADSPDDLPPKFATTWALLRGEEPIWESVPSETVESIDGFWSAVHAIPVEVGSQALTLMISGRGEKAWAPSCELRRPDGSIALTCDDPSVVSDEFYLQLRVASPEDGNWTLIVYHYGLELQQSYIWAHSDNPAPGCSAGVEAQVLVDEPANGLVISASASWNEPLGEGVTYLLEVETPNGTKLPIETMSINDRKNGGEFVFTDFQGRGEYDVLVTCVVTPFARFAPGERPELEELLAEEAPPTFVRQASTGFYLNVPDYMPIPTGGDCDDDGIPDTAETDPLGDDDQDGVPNACDPDNDGDEVPDTDDLCPDEAETWGQSGPGRDPVDGCPVPEPGFAAALGTGLLLLAVESRRRRPRRASALPPRRATRRRSPR